MNSLNTFVCLELYKMKKKNILIKKDKTQVNNEQKMSLSETTGRGIKPLQFCQWTN